MTQISCMPHCIMVSLTVIVNSKIDLVTRVLITAERRLKSLQVYAWLYMELL